MQMLRHHSINLRLTWLDELDSEYYLKISQFNFEFIARNITHSWDFKSTSCSKVFTSFKVSNEIYDIRCESHLCLKTV